MWLKAGSVLFAIPGIILLVFYGLEVSVLTECTQNGGHFDFIKQVCSDTEQPLISYYQRHPALVNSMMLLSVIGTFAMIWGMLQRGMSRPKD